jgi:uncharacterized membrane protein
VERTPSVGARSRAEVTPASRPSIGAAGILLGIGFGGFFDGVLLHQILQWHHMLTSTGSHPATTVAGLEDNTLADGLFHALTFVAALTGLALLWAAVRNGVALAGRHLVGLMHRMGGVRSRRGHVDHQILTVHHVNMDGGLALARSGLRAEEDALGGLRL